jgi:hypothetical protein
LSQIEIAKYRHAPKIVLTKKVEKSTKAGNTKNKGNHCDIAAK